MEKQVAKDTRTFREISKIVLPSPCLNKAYKQMRLAAMQGQPALALFAGVEAHSVFHIQETIIPRQERLPRPGRVRSRVPEEERQRIRAWLQAHQSELIAQIHSYPSQAFPAAPHHGWPLIHIIGGISIFVPDFALGPTSPETWAVYRLAADNKWIGLDKNEICYLFQIAY